MEREIIFIHALSQGFGINTSRFIRNKKEKINLLSSESNFS